MSKTAQLKSFLKNVSFLTDADCQMFEEDLEIADFRKKDWFLKEGQICRRMGFVNQGSFRMYYLMNGKEINTHFVFENEFLVDYNSFLNQQASRYYIEALEKSEIVTFPFSTMQAAYHRSHNWERFGRIMAEQSYQITTNRVESFLFMEGKERYQSALENYPTIFERVPLYHIASYLGLERESLSRLRKKISEEQRL
ncbi:MAG: Crp/Fnr family transcriptional regulator [Bacteroidota bacterium]